MGVRESISERGRGHAVVVGASLIIAIAVIAIALEAVGGRPRYESGSAARSFFTVDDGRTYFADIDSNIPPYDHNGQQAVHAYVYQCGDGKPFVVYLERYTVVGIKAIQAIREGRASGLLRQQADNQREVKRPGDAKWTPVSDSKQAMLIATPVCPDGGAGTPEPVQP